MGLHPPCPATLYPKSFQILEPPRVMLKSLSKERQPHSSWPTREGHVPNQQCHSQLSLSRASWHFFGTRNRVLHIPGFLQSPEIAPSCLGADTQLRLRLNFPDSSRELFKLPGGCDAAPVKESPADTEEPKTFAEVTKDHEPSV